MNETTFRFSHRWERLAAALLDMAVFFVPWMVIEPLGEWYRYGSLALFSTLASAVYFTCLEGPLGKGQTLGKRLLGLRAVSTDGRLLTFGGAFKRYFFLQLAPYLLTLPMLFLGASHFLAFLLSQLATGYFLLDVALLFRDPHRRALHDYLSRSLVLKSGEDIPTGWPTDLPKPFLQPPWKNYWVTLSLVALFTISQIAIGLSARRLTPLPQSAFQQGVRSGSLVIYDARQTGSLWHLEVGQPTFNPIARRRNARPDRQERLVRWVAERLIKKKVIDPATCRQLIFTVRPDLFEHSSDSQWVVDTRTLTATLSATADRPDRLPLAPRQPDKP
jgi:uncharacterized RDD family membrane protein YckC